MWNKWIEPRTSSGLYEPADAPMLALWCVMVARVFETEKATPFGGVYEDQDAYGSTVFKAHPGVNMLIKLSAELRALSSRLALDPIARLALGAAAPDRHGLNLPTGAPPVYTPGAAGMNDAGVPRRCEEHGRKWRKACDRCSQVKAAHPPKPRASKKA